MNLIHEKIVTIISIACAVIIWIQRRTSSEVQQNTSEADLTVSLNKTIDVIRKVQEIQFSLIEAILKPYQYAVWIDLAQFENKGDSAITVGELILLKKLNLGIVGYCFLTHCNQVTYGDMEKIVREHYDKSKTVVLFHGGGNLFTYRSNDAVRFQAFQAFKGYSFLIFPQSISIPQKSIDDGYVSKTAHKYHDQDKLKILLRDVKSLELAKGLNMRENVNDLLLFPDIAFQMGPQKRTMPPAYDILWIQRNDREGTKDNIPKPPLNISMMVDDWFWSWRTPKGDNAWEDAMLVAQQGLTFLQRGRVVVTDRLHGHILATLLDIPHVILDTKYNKLKNLHETTTKHVKNVETADNPEQALNLAITLLETFKYTLPSIIL